MSVKIGVCKMIIQVSRRTFAKALEELGHDPGKYQGKKITLQDMAKIYKYQVPYLLDAIEVKDLSAHYDYKRDNIWVDAFEAAYYYYCDQQKKYE